MSLSPDQPGVRRATLNPTSTSFSGAVRPVRVGAVLVGHVKLRGLAVFLHGCFPGTLPVMLRPLPPPQLAVCQLPPRRTISSLSGLRSAIGHVLDLVMVTRSIA